MRKLKEWKDLKEKIESNFTKEDLEEIELEKEIIRATIKARKDAELTQQELSEKTGIIQPSIAKIEKFKRSPQCSTLIKLLYPLGYTLRVVPLENKKK